MPFEKPFRNLTVYRARQDTEQNKHGKQPVITMDAILPQVKIAISDYCSYNKDGQVQTIYNILSKIFWH